ncbi:unnamed protein product [Paramecium sonneborni]|uniref:Uncharacterized protein n=1 Tax=Paramecium sonneborni TaxID=65129 RepID=A0A8S1NAT0_9CILI|nr:unnamed protein product [Paramecium sonneborni]
MENVNKLTQISYLQWFESGYIMKMMQNKIYRRVAFQGILGNENCIEMKHQQDKEECELKQYINQKKDKYVIRTIY